MLDMLPNYSNLPSPSLNNLYEGLGLLDLKALNLIKYYTQIKRGTSKKGNKQNKKHKRRIAL